MTNQNKLERFSDFGISMLHDRYLLADEKPTDLFHRVANAYSDNKEHAERLFEYMIKCWFMPATPVLSNGGTQRGLPISCFLNECEDSLESIDNLWHENTYLASRGGGIGSYWGNVRSLGEKIAHNNGKTSGIIPFLKVVDSLTLAISQGNLRRGNAAVYLPVWHPEIEEFIEIRKPTGGDTNRRCLNIHNAVVINDEFMLAVEQGLDWDLISPKTGEILHTVKARDIWMKILTLRVETGEPYILFIDNVKKYSPHTYKYLDLQHKTSNLCSEITLTTGLDHLKNDRTAVCCLSSVNIEYFDEWSGNEQFIEDILCFLDNVLDDFAKRAPKAMYKAIYSSKRERSVGLGVMGFHSYLQKKMIPIESAISKSINKQIFEFLRNVSDKISNKLALQKGPCIDNFDVCILTLIKEGKLPEEYLRYHKTTVDFTNFTDIPDFTDLYTDYISYLKGNQSLFEFDIFNIIQNKIKTMGERFTHKIAVAPTASISEICGGCSPGIEPFIANTFSKKNLTGIGSIRNKYLKQLLQSKNLDNENTWQDIIANEGSVQHLDLLNDYEKSVFKTAFEINQIFLVELSADRTPYVCQAQSFNIFLPSTISRSILHKIHLLGWKKGLKSFYYLRSRSVGRGEKINQMGKNYDDLIRKTENDQCLSCE